MIKNYCKAIVSISALAVLFGSALFLNNTYAAIMADVDIMWMTYWDKNGNNVYDDWIDRPILAPPYAVNTSGNSWSPYFLLTPIYFTWAWFWWNNAVNLSYEGTYSFWISQSSSAWVSLMNQWFTTSDPISSSVVVTWWVWYITWLQVGLDFSCVWSTGQTVEFIEYSCPAWYLSIWAMCYTGTNVTGGPCTTNADCTSGWTCNGYSPPSTPFKYNDALPWNASHPNWNDKPHAPSMWQFCRNGDEWWDSDPWNPPPCWLYGTCGMAIWGGWCQWFITNNDSSPGTCSTSSSNWIAATETTVTEYVACTPASCTPWSWNIADYTISPNATASTITYIGTGLDSTKTVRYHLQYSCWAIPTTHWEGTMTIASGATSGTGDNSTIATACLWNMPVNREDEYIVDVWIACDNGCVVTTESPTVCDLEDVWMAWVCYIPGTYGTTLLVSNWMVWVNTVTPAYPLDVDWTIRSAEILTLSDARLKTSIEKIDSALDKIRSINWYTFTWKDSWKPDLWVLAQEIEKIFADAVATDVNGKKTVQYNALLAPIIEAIKELNTQIDSLYNNKFDDQVKRIEAIENKVK